MADYRTEEEQIELLKKWWAENGRSTVAGVVIALLGYLSWAGWTSHRQSRIEAAADLYQQLSFVPPGQDPAAYKAKALEIAGQIKADYPETTYAAFAALHLASDRVAKGDLPGAREMLEWALAQKPEASLEPVIRIRLGQVLYAAADYEAALKVLDAVGSVEAWRAASEELRGDIRQAQQQPDKARESYQAALEALDKSGAQERRPYVEMKLSEAGGQVSAPAAAPAVSGG